MNTPLASSAATPVVIHRQDYRPPAFLVDKVDLHFSLHPTATRVRARLALRRQGESRALELDGEAVTLIEASLDGAPLAAPRLEMLPSGGLRIADAPDSFVLETLVEISPEANTELSGLYLSGGNYFTQCEAEGFRRITFFPDRPDVMARYSVTIEADRATCPVLLSNGNPAGSGELPEGRHWARWEDPHPKPSYLFALVAGDLVAVRDHFTTQSGRNVALAIYVRDGDQDACGHAMASLKASMAWDEAEYGLEYDLDVFNIAAVSDFNMGAMENKGLNIFNTKYILARPETATDADYEGIETVVSHEYFHNWTGNRVTCRDWFQLSLKEGLTVFRDQQFSEFMGSAAVKRLANVRRLRAAQFPEDAGPMAHPVRPDSYVEINNFYTATVYQKGSEVVRMMRELIGAANFRKGMDLYIARHDNQAVTIEDFVQAMQDASGVDLSRFSRWYAQAGTPELRVAESFDPATGRYVLTLSQATPPTPGQPEKQPVPIPVAMGLLAPDGTPLPLRLAGENAAEAPEERVLLLEEAQQDFVFEGLGEGRPTPSLLRGFSAPVKLSGLPLESLGFLAAQDSDPFVRWESGQQYATAEMLRLVAAQRAGEAPALPEGLAAIIAAVLDHAQSDPAFTAEALALPSEDFVAGQMKVADPEAIHAVRQALRREIGARFAPRLAALHDSLGDTDPYRIDGASIGRRALRNAALSYLAQAPGTDGLPRARAQFAATANMTDVLAALRVLADSTDPAREEALAAFHARWRNDPLVLDKWFTLQATSSRADTLAVVQALALHPDFDLRNPNRVRALVGAFAAGNPVHFHAASGEGYRFLAEMVIALDPVNSQVAARMVSPLGDWKRQSPERAAMMRAELERILARPNLSKGTFEKVSKSLAE
ncbi:aminopeptidase N [Pseudoroseomonas wenyumeiae]|uniref:Aminopeptidase N n=1 Tax=Teichococcus wenyumeiae TaxID=2478470 RepID=A0A3A9JGD9_9PROT|nr:aminopeptidase N [Pseudoroseomonas wenyumeiae]RKK02706.1 aminopeptidase N [Pseudoroseomonas wenyumeiae]RMI27016.1 aminopeptidase N [Pseudoroseomonas wenyumeiae]